MQWYYSGDGAAVGPRTADDIEDLFVTRQITADTLVWRKGMADWVALGDTDEFAHLADAPPPLEAGRQAMAVAGEGETLLDTRRADDDGRAAAEDDRHEGDDEPAFELAAASAGPRLAGPWERYFARSIDVTIIASVLLTGLYWALPWISPQLLLQLSFVDTRVLVVLLLPVAFFLNSIVITLFGNSLGKAIFDIRAEPIDGRPRFGLAGNLKRELIVWVRGWALGIPLANFFTMIPAYRAVLRGEPAPYDRELATVRAYSDSRWRRGLGMLFAVALYVGIAMLNSMDRSAMDEIAQPGVWWNPATQLSATIPGGWKYEPFTGPDGGPLYGFTQVRTGLIAILAAESLPNLNMEAYLAALAKGVSGTIGLGDWSESNLSGVWTASGQTTPGGYAATVHAARGGDQYWRIIYIDQLSATPREIVEPEMTAALFRSAGIGAP
ncbi:RDD family protein [Devosia sp.]|jgi:hypothetical protein|uniref:RDD family protein n=1 Tax=Devosia sp. TaxID=1871048 RepID=UPI003F72C553